MKKLLMLLTSVLMSTSLFALDGSYNVTSDYQWRGVSQTDGNAAIQVGVEHERNGFYGGLWTSNVDFNDDTNIEYDLYGGYSGEYKSLSYDVGYISYKYDGSTDLDFEERYISLGYGPLTVGHNRDEDNGLEYNYADVSLGFIPVVDVSLHYGEYDGHDDKSILIEYGLPHNLTLGVVLNDGPLSEVKNDSFVISLSSVF